MKDLPHRELTAKIIQAIYEVQNELGSGFRERVYRRALVVLLREIGLDAVEEQRILVWFHGKVVGRFYADIVVNGVVLIEVKAAAGIDAVAESQILNYLKAAGGGVGILVNFGKRAEYQRRVMGDPNANLPNLVRKDKKKAGDGTPVAVPPDRFIAPDRVSPA